jgi:hypothetical protein
VTIMKKLAAAALALSFAVAAQAQKPETAPKADKSKTEAAPPASGEAMTPPKPGPETLALKPFAQSSTMTGTLAAGAWGKNPELPAKATSKCKWTAGNMWVACDIDETIGAGKTAMKWSGHWMFGWDLAAKAYVGVMASSMGEHEAMKGTLEGSKLTWESMHEMKAPPHMPSKLRITEDATDPKAIKFTEEALVDGKWVTMENAVEKPTSK